MSQMIQSDRSRTYVLFRDIMIASGRGFFRSRAHCYARAVFGGKPMRGESGCDVMQFKEETQGALRGASLIKNELKAIAPTKMECLAKEIREGIESIRNYIQIDQQEILLMAVTDISNYSNPSPEGDILSISKITCHPALSNTCKVLSLQRTTRFAFMLRTKISNGLPINTYTIRRCYLKKRRSI